MVINSSLLPNNYGSDNVVFLCIGTDRSTGDSLGPLVGTFLKQSGYKNVYGTIENPVHAVNLSETIQILPKDKIVIAIDACLGKMENIGKIRVSRGTLKPGAGVHKELPAVGDYSIHGVVNVSGFMEYFVLQNTRLSLVMKMAAEIADMLKQKLPLHSVKEYELA